MLGLAASKRRISSCQTGVRSGPAFVSQNVIVTGAELVLPDVLPPVLALPPQATTNVASRPATSPLSLDRGVLMSYTPLLVYSVHEVMATIMAVAGLAVNRPGILRARTG